MGIPSFNLYRLTGKGLKRKAIYEIKLKVLNLYLRGKGQLADIGPSYYCSARQQQAGDKSRYHAVIVDRPKAITCNAVPVYCKTWILDWITFN